ncbi:hypothetical protein K0U83_14905, partial [bacterium]|nr:hypothetical protein [bacterium]
MRGVLNWGDCRTIIRAEVARAGSIPGHDADDVRQEAAVAAARALSLVDESKAPRAYVRTSVRNALIKLRRAAMAAKRIPHDAWGRPLPIAGGDMILGVQRDETDPENRAYARELVRALRGSLDERDWGMLVSSFANGDRLSPGGRGTELRLIAAHAREILNRIICRETGDNIMTNTTAIASTPPELLPECHADGKEPQGYETTEPECLLCPDKFSCLPRGIKTS